MLSKGDKLYTYQDGEIVEYIVQNVGMFFTNLVSADGNETKLVDKCKLQDKSSHWWGNPFNYYTSKEELQEDLKRELSIGFIKNTLENEQIFKEIKTETLLYLCELIKKDLCNERGDNNGTDKNR